LRLDVDGVPALDGFSVETTGERVLVLGGPRALFEAAAGLRAIRAGDLRVEARPPREAVRERLVAGAPLDPALPSRWTLAQYVAWSARLAGLARTEADRLAHDALERLQLASSAASRLGAASLALRRAAVLAAALATGAPALLLEDPLTGLPDDAARSFSRIVARAVADRRTITFAGHVPLESPLALAADEAIVLSGSDVAAQGAPGELAAADRTLALRVNGDVAAFAAAVDRSGGRATVTAGASRPCHVRVDLGALAARDLLRIATEARALVVELRPIGRAFA
jgi:ABC-2 type transport system ATP-binding protein